MYFSFIVLHYKAVKATIACVDSILGLDQKGDSILVVVVDNGSNDGSNVLLGKRYKDAQNVDVISTGKNLGFARGNNFGFEYVCRVGIPDYIIACNNDTVIPDRGFLSAVKRATAKTGFDVLGPDVFNPFTHEHQSPCGDGLVALQEIDELIEKCQKELKQLEHPSPRQKAYLLLRDSKLGNYFAAIRHRMIDTDEFRSWNKMQSGVVLHGSFLIFSHDFIVSMPWLFSPETFMYLEENFLQLNAKIRNQNIIYYPDIQICHLHGTSTAIGYSAWSQRQLFYYRNVIQSLERYRQFVKTSIQ